MQEIDWFSLLTVPLSWRRSAVINWTGVWMLFNPIEFRGWRVPGLQGIVELLPRKVQQVPGIMSGGVGWQGIIPSRAAKMGSIAGQRGSPSQAARPSSTPSCSPSRSPSTS